MPNQTHELPADVKQRFLDKFYYLDSYVLNGSSSQYDKNDDLLPQDCRTEAQRLIEFWANELSLAHKQGGEEEAAKSKKLANLSYKLLEKLGAGSPTLATYGSWKDTLDDEDVLEQIEELLTYRKDQL